jgi:hypothetical protein
MQRKHGQGTIRSDGYVYVGRKKKLRHITLAEEALGKPLPKGAVVHHWNGDKADNSPENLVICPNTTYHALLHRRQRKLKAMEERAYLRSLASS